MASSNDTAQKHLLVTGGAGFIGSNFVGLLLSSGYRVTILDALTYAGHLANVREYLKPGLCDFVEGRIEDNEFVEALFRKNEFDGVVHFAAESHVDNSITGPEAFLKTNVMGTFCLLQASKGMRDRFNVQKQQAFRFVHVSTDEVFGSLGPTDFFSEKTPYAPNSPYSASKAGSDFLARAWFHTYGLPTVITNCSNNYGPKQFPEKLIPRMLTQALKGGELPVYGQGTNVRDWIHVEDHCRGVLLAFERGQPGESYCFGGRAERDNLTVVKAICELLEKKRPRQDKSLYSDAIRFVADRLGHDFRYAIDSTKAEVELGFNRRYENFESGLESTVDWYLSQENWLREISERGSK